MGETISKEYAEFSKNRKRLKTDFALVTGKTVNQFSGMHDLLDNVVKQSDYNTMAIKMMLDA